MNEEIVNRKSRLEKLNAQIVEHGDTDEDLHITNKFSGNRRESMNARDGRKSND
jgi:hypothetical protein